MQPETSSSYLGSAPRKHKSICQPRALLVEAEKVRSRRTVEYCAVGGEEAVLERLLIVACLERILLCDDVVDVLACKEGDLVAAVTVEDAEEGEPLGVVLGGIGVGGEEI